MSTAFHLASMLFSHAYERPQSPALIHENKVVTYGELIKKAEAHSRLLDRSMGGSKKPVAVQVNKSPSTISLILACLRAERPALLLAADLPPNQVESLAARSGCRIVYTPAGETISVSPRSPENLPGDTALILTTSGTTGSPKLVPLGREAIDRFASWAGPRFGMAPGVRVLNHAPLNFDLCLLDVWTSLAFGATVVLVDPDRGAQGSYLTHLVSKYNITVMQAVPTVYGLLFKEAEIRESDFPSVEHAILTGDSTPASVHTRLQRFFPRARCYNIYGCTETNDSFLYECTGSEGEGGEGLPIGSPIPGVRALLLTTEGNPAPAGTAGELYVSTPFQSSGYLELEQRQKAFIAHPLGLDDRLWYRTGDLAHRSEDGTTRLIGRSDFQVKIRGVTTNLVNVERVLLDHPEVLEAGVTVISDSIGGQKLLAFVRRSTESSLNSLTLRAHCVAHLPRSSVPSQLHITDELLPRTTTGKIDRLALARNEPDPTPSEASPSSLPHPTEVSSGS